MATNTSTNMSTPPVYPTYPPGPPQLYPGIPPRQRRWPLVAGVGAAGLTIGAVVASLITFGVTDKTNGSTATAAPVTITMTPSAAPTPSPLPTAQADRQTCTAWKSSGDLINAASMAQSIIPQGMTIIDPAVRTNPDWTAGVLKAGALYGQAADALSNHLAPGSTPALAETANTASAALRTLAITYKAFDPASGNAYAVTRTTANALDVLCERLAP